MVHLEDQGGEMTGAGGLQPPQPEMLHNHFNK